MKVLLDTNVILDVLLDREPFSTDAAHSKMFGEKKDPPAPP